MKRTRSDVRAVALALAAALPLQSPHALADEAPMRIETRMEEGNRALVEAGFAAWSAGNGSPYDLLAEDVNWTIVGNSDASKTYAGKAAFIEEVIRPFNARMRRGLKPTIRSLHAVGDDVVIFFDAAGTARDGRPYENTYASFWEMKDGRVVEAHAFFDAIAFNDLWRRVRPD